MMAEHSALASPPSNESDNDRFEDARLTEAHQLFLHQMRQQRQARKSRSVHTISLNSPTRPTIRSPEVFVQRDAIRRSAQDEESADSCGSDIFGGADHDSPLQQNESVKACQSGAVESTVDPSFSPPHPDETSKGLNVTSFHGSMEDIHRPKNFRSVPPTPSARRQSEPASTHFTTALNFNFSVSESNISESSLDSSFKSANDGSPSRDQDHDEHSDEDNTDVGDMVSLSTSMSNISLSHTEPMPNFDEHELELLRVPVQLFLAGGIKQQTSTIAKYEARLYNLRLTNAIRHVSNSLLLNSRRSHRKETLRVRGETSQLKLQESNLTLQLRVTRHVQANEREKGAGYDHELQELRSEIANIQKAEKRTIYEIRSTEEDLQTTRVEGDNLQTDKMDLKREMDEALERKAALENLLEAEKKDRDENSNLCSNLERQMCDLQAKTKDLTRQTNQWKERASENEAHGLQMKRKLDSMRLQYEELKKQYEVQYEQMMNLTKDISQNEESVDNIEDLLEFSINEHDVEQKELKSTVEELKVEGAKVKRLEESNEKLRVENENMEREIQVYKSLELQRRRTIMNGIKFWRFILEFFIFGPDIAFGTLYADRFSRMPIFISIKGRNFRTNE